jgi:hypothetical protein
MFLSITTWGHAAWIFLHAVAHASPKKPTAEQRENMRAYLHALATVLPCAKCQRHMRQYLREHLTEDSLKSRASLVEFVHCFHNSVNAKLGKPQLTLQEHYDHVFGSARRRRAAEVRQNLLLAVVLFTFLAVTVAIPARHPGRSRKFGTWKL